jgi:hypothetical protein
MRQGRGLMCLRLRAVCCIRQSGPRICEPTFRAAPRRPCLGGRDPASCATGFMNITEPASLWSGQNPSRPLSGSTSLPGFKGKTPPASQQTPQLRCVTRSSRDPAGLSLVRLRFFQEGLTRAFWAIDCSYDFSWSSVRRFVPARPRPVPFQSFAPRTVPENRAGRHGEAPTLGTSASVAGWPGERGGGSRCDSLSHKGTRSPS